MNLQLVYFIMGFVVILGAFITFVAVASARLSAAVPPQTYSVVEAVIIGGILLGVIGMIQTWVLSGFRVGFLVLLFCTLAFILWSHVTPNRAPGSGESASRPSANPPDKAA